MPSFKAKCSADTAELGVADRPCTHASWYNIIGNACPKLYPRFYGSRCFYLFIRFLLLLFNFKNHRTLRPIKYCKVKFDKLN